MFENDDFLDEVKGEMQKHVQNTLKKVERFVHPSLMQNIIWVIARSFFESETIAENIAQSLNLSKMDLLAILGDFEGFKEEYAKEKHDYEVQLAGEKYEYAI